MPSVKKEDRRDSEHDAICAWLLQQLKSGYRPDFIGDQKLESIEIEKRLTPLSNQRRVLGFVDVFVSFGTGAFFIEVKSSREHFSAGDVIRQLKGYIEGSEWNGIGVLVCNCKLDTAAKTLLAQEGIHVWELPPATTA